MRATKNCRVSGSKCYNFELKHVKYNTSATNCDLTGSNEVGIEISIEGLDKHSKSKVNHFYAIELKATNTPFVEFSKDKQKWDPMYIEIKHAYQIDSRVSTPEILYIRKCTGAPNITATVECKFSHSSTQDLCKPCNHTATIFIDLR